MKSTRHPPRLLPTDQELAAIRGVNQISASVSSRKIDQGRRQDTWERLWGLQETAGSG